MRKESLRSLFILVSGELKLSCCVTKPTVSIGWVDTDMGATIKDWWAKHNPDLKPISVQQSVDDVLRIIAQAKPQAKVPLYNHTGQELSW